MEQPPSIQAQWLLTDWLTSFEQRAGHDIQLGLERIKAVAMNLKLNLNPESVVIMVGGTNGKGSTVAALEAIYCQAGYRVAVYTSPHLTIFNERIRFNRQYISDAALCAAFTDIEQARGSIPLTYFEMATLAALVYFNHCKPDVMILEVGLGGRLDATNIVEADLAIVTTVDLDHQDFLGDTIDAIAYEKAGIFRANQQAIYADRIVPKGLLDYAETLNVNLVSLAQHYSFILTENAFEMRLLSGKRLAFSKPFIHANAAAAGIIASEILANRLPVAPVDLKQAIESVQIAGRLQVFYDTIWSILDVSHNPQAVQLLCERVQSLGVSGRIHAVFSGLKDKDLCGLIKPMCACVDHWYIAPLENKRAASETLLMDAFERAGGVDVSLYGSIVEAYRAAKRFATPGDLVVVYGSFFVVGPIMAEKTAEEEWIWNG